MPRQSFASHSALCCSLLLLPRAYPWRCAVLARSLRWAVCSHHSSVFRLLASFLVGGLRVVLRSFAHGRARRYVSVRSSWLSPHQLVAVLPNPSFHADVLRLAAPAFARG